MALRLDPIMEWVPADRRPGDAELARWEEVIRTVVFAGEVTLQLEGQCWRVVRANRFRADAYAGGDPLPIPEDVREPLTAALRSAGLNVC
jgi:hypothetical protein